MLSTTKFYFCT